MVASSDLPEVPDMADFLEPADFCFSNPSCGLRFAFVLRAIMFCFVLFALLIVWIDVPRMLVSEVDVRKTAKKVRGSLKVFWTTMKLCLSIVEQLRQALKIVNAQRCIAQINIYHAINAYRIN